MAISTLDRLRGDKGGGDRGGVLPVKAISTVDRLREDMGGGRYGRGVTWEGCDMGRGVKWEWCDMGGGRQGRGVTCQGDIHSGQIKGRQGRGVTGEGWLPAMAISTVDRLRGDKEGGDRGGVLPVKAISTVDRLRGDMGGRRQGRGVTCDGDIDSGQIKGRHGRGVTGEGCYLRRRYPRWTVMMN